jgi:hypothetical protein
MTKAKEADIRSEVEQLQTLDKDDLRARWRKMFGKEPPPTLTKDAAHWAVAELVMHQRLRK